MLVAYASYLAYQLRRQKNVYVPVSEVGTFDMCSLLLIFDIEYTIQCLLIQYPVNLLHSTG
jgi:hypothetical protein